MALALASQRKMADVLTGDLGTALPALHCCLLVLAPITSLALSFALTQLLDQEQEDDLHYHHLMQLIDI